VKSVIYAAVSTNFKRAKASNLSSTNTCIRHFFNVYCYSFLRNVCMSWVFPFPIPLYFFGNLGHLMQVRFQNRVFRHLVGLRRREISPSQGLYLHKTTQRRKWMTNSHALSGIGTHDNGTEAARIHALYRVVIVIILGGLVI
jgi:hypothetical protein